MASSSTDDIKKQDNDKYNNSSIISGFQLVSYKVDNFQLKTQNKISFISLSLKPEDSWKASISMMKPTLYKKNMTCLGGLKISLGLPDNTNKEQDLISLDCSIVGLFKIINTQDYEKQKEIYDNLIKYQIPTILLSFLRSTVISFFANAGYGSFFFPLINMYQIANGQEIEISYQE